MSLNVETKEPATTLQFYRDREEIAKSWLAACLKSAKVQRFTVIGRDVDHILARELLKLNQGNRKLNKNHVQLIANAIHNGEWIETGDTIKLSSDGRLIDGQHRLQAIAKSNQAVKLDFAFGIDDAAQMRIDVNMVRQPSQQLQISGVKNGSVLAAAARAILTLKQGHIHTDWTISKFAIFDFCLNDTILQNCAIEAVSLRKKLGNRTAASGICVGLYLIENSDVGERKYLNRFLRDLETGANLSEQSAALVLRHNLLRGSNATGEQMPYDIAAWFIKAFAAYVKNQPCNRMQFQPTRESFPDLAKLLEQSGTRFGQLLDSTF